MVMPRVHGAFKMREVIALLAMVRVIYRNVPGKRQGTIDKEFSAGAQKGNSPKGSTGCWVAEGVVHGVEDGQVCDLMEA